MIPLLLIPFFLFPIAHCQQLLPAPAPFLSRVPLDCRRISSAFCCSSRVRQSCAQLCHAFAPCVPPFLPQSGQQPQQPTAFGGSIDETPLNVPGGLGPPFLPPFSPTLSGNQNNFGQRRFTTEGERQTPTNGNLPTQFKLPPMIPPPQPPFGLILPPPDAPFAQGTPVPIEDLDKEEPPFDAMGEQTEVEAAATESPAESMPTLLPPGIAPPVLQPSIDESTIEDGDEKLKESDETPRVTKTAGGAIDGIASGKVTARKKSSSGAAIKPPHLMRELEELDGQLEAAGQNQWWAPIRLSLSQGQGQEQSGVDPHQPRTTIIESAFPATEMPSRNFAEFTSPPAAQLWSFSIKPSETPNEQAKSERSNSQNFSITQSENVEPNVALQQQGNDGLFGENINVFVDKVFNKDLLNSIASITNKNHSRSIVHNNHAAKEFPTLLPSSSTSSIPPEMPTEQCGVPPNFKPCLPLEQANARLQACCQQRKMPAGCLPLCRYDTTQAEVKMAFDKGQCGILNVTPFLECASGGQNNLDCCRHREIAKRSGPQCEVFCTGEKLGLLGLQHLICSTLIQPILECHHSGLKH